MAMASGGLSMLEDNELTVQLTDYIYNNGLSHLLRSVASACDKRADMFDEVAAKGYVDYSNPATECREIATAIRVILRGINCCGI